MVKQKTKVIKLKTETYNNLIKHGKPYKLGESVNSVVERIIRKLDKQLKHK